MPKSKNPASRDLPEQKAVLVRFARNSDRFSPTGPTRRLGGKYSLQDPGQGHVFFYTVRNAICQGQKFLCQL